MSDPFIGEIKMVGFNFAPRYWATCDGQLLPIAQNTALFSLLGTMYGGNGINTFALPDLRGRVPIHQGQGPGLSPYTIGQVAGTENTTLLSSQMPTHNHLVNVNTGAGTQASPGGGFLAVESTGTSQNYAGSANGSLNAAAVSTAGGNQPFSILQPYLCINFVIALQGIFPSRN